MNLNDHDSRLHQGLSLRSQETLRLLLQMPLSRPLVGSLEKIDFLLPIITTLQQNSITSLDLHIDGGYS